MGVLRVRVGRVLAGSLHPAGLLHRNLPILSLLIVYALEKIHGRLAVRLLLQNLLQLKLWLILKLAGILVQLDRRWRHDLVTSVALLLGLHRAGLTVLTQDLLLLLVSLCLRRGLWLVGLGLLGLHVPPSLLLKGCKSLGEGLRRRKQVLLALGWRRRNKMIQDAAAVIDEWH